VPLAAKDAELNPKPFYNVFGCQLPVRFVALCIALDETDSLVA